MKKKTLRKQIASMYAAWSQERDDYKGENGRLRAELEWCERRLRAWQEWAMHEARRESRSESEHRS